MIKKCLHCEDKFEGRSDKIFCTIYCKSIYHYKKRKFDDKTFFKKIDDQLRLNRRLLQHFNSAGKATIRREELHEAGFNPNIFTHYWKNKRGQVYFFCFDNGFMKITNNNQRKYSLIKWQEQYMKLDRTYLQKENK